MCAFYIHRGLPWSQLNVGWRTSLEYILQIDLEELPYWVSLICKLILSLNSHKKLGLEEREQVDVETWPYQISLILKLTSLLNVC